MKAFHRVRKLALLLTVLPLVAAAPATNPNAVPVQEGRDAVPPTPQDFTDAVVRATRIAVATFEIDAGRFPSTQEGLVALIKAPTDLTKKWRGPYLQKVPVDGWGNGLAYLGPRDAPDGRYLVLSGGAPVAGRVDGPAEIVAKVRVALADMAEMRDQLGVFAVDNGRLPTTQEGLDALVRLPADVRLLKTWHPRLDIVPKDPWGHGYVYGDSSAPGSNAFELYSTGPDGKAGTPDDIPVRKVR